MNRFIAASGIVTALACSAAQAAPFVDINFDLDAIGSQPSVAPASNPLIKPTAIGGYTALTYDSPPTAANGTLVVADIGGMTKAAHLTSNPANNVLGALWVDTSVSQTSQQFLLSFDVNIVDAPTVALAQPKTVDGGLATAGILLGMNTFGTAVGVRFAAAPTSANGGVFAIRNPANTDLQTFFSYVEGQTYNIQLYADYDTGLVSTFVDGVFTGDRAFAAGPAANVTTQEFFFHLNGDLGNANSVALDNISAVPEPGTLGVLVMSGMALAARRRRR
jgi:hypothetical protein